MSCSPRTTTNSTSPWLSSSAMVRASMGEPDHTRDGRRLTCPRRMAERDRLDSYRQKRDFGDTPEPASPKTGSPTDTELRRFVVQEHHARRLHWDLRLEHDGTLASWAVPKGIPPDPERNNLAVRTEDHPLEYLE